MTSAREQARQLAQQYIADGKPLDWFEVLYANAQGDETLISWADMEPNPNLTVWAEREKLTGAGKRALVVGCGLGDDAEYLARLGFTVTAFDVAPTAIDWCKTRFAGSAVQYQTRDVLKVPESWYGQFDFIFEAYTLQVLPPDLRTQAMDQIVRCLAPEGTLLVIARGREVDDDPGAMPWPLTREELGRFHELGLKEVTFEDYLDDDTRRFRVEYQK
jgi:SAM-dependent methyltransferase